ncbi:MAG: hypothetical protein HUU06_05660 [Planctomycetaceae bacterium]|nr:hypothetical protein [Planctomycetota bacterium]NUN52259.1 hypothetical protein [Planctomycetaceae bacterium]
MRLDRSDVIDFIGVSKSGDRVVLTLADDFEGPDQGLRCSMLQEKVHHYLDFVASGQVWEHLMRPVPVGQGRSTVIVEILIAAKHDLDGDGRRFLAELQGVAGSEGVELRFKRLGGS